MTKTRDLADLGGGFIQAGTGAVQRTVESKLQDVVSVKDFGAVGDGVANDTVAIQAAITYALANSPRKVVFPTGTYKCNAALGSFTGSNVEIDFQNSVIDFTGVSLSEQGPLLEFTGTYSTTAVITSNALSGTQSIAVNSSGFIVGDMVRVYSESIWDSTRTSTRVGEINFVETVPNGSSVNLTTELQSGYTVAASGTLQKLMPVRNLSIKNATFIGPSGNDELLGLRIRLGVACLIENIRSYDVDKIHIQLTDCVFSKVTKCHLEQSNHSAQAYGISFADACQDCTAIDNSFVDVRYSLSTNNNVSTSYGITRRILFSNNVVSDSAKATGGAGGDAIDTHAGAEDIFIIGNTVNSSSNYGINFEARTGSVSNNFIKNTASGGILINPRADSAGSVTVIGNTLLAIGDDAAEYGIYVVANTADLVNCIVSGNRVVAFAQPIRAVNSSTFVLDRIAITGNSVQKSSSSTTLNGIEVTGASLASVSGNSILAGATGINLTDCSNSTVNGNSIEIVNTIGSNGWGIRLSGNCSYVNVNGNTVYYSASGLTSTFGVVFSTTTTYSSAWSNTTRGFTTNVNVSIGTGNVAANNI